MRLPSITFNDVLRSRVFAAVVVSAVVFLIVGSLRELGQLQNLELAVYDWHIQLQPRAAEDAPPRRHEDDTVIHNNRFCRDDPRRRREGWGGGRALGVSAGEAACRAGHRLRLAKQ